MNFKPYIYILYYQSNLLNYLPHNPSVTLIKCYSFVTELLEQPGSESRRQIVLAIREWRHTNVDKQRLLLADIDVFPPKVTV